MILPSGPQLSASGWLILLVIYAPSSKKKKKLPLTELIIIRLIPIPIPSPIPATTPAPAPDHVTCPPHWQHCSCCRRGCIVYCDNSCQRTKQMSTAH